MWLIYFNCMMMHGLANFKPYNKIKFRKLRGFYLSVSVLLFVGSFF